MSAPRVALALGGGSARGLAHIVVLKAFDELGIRPTVIAGTSMGALCGAAYAAGLSAAEIRAECEEMLANRAAFLRRFTGKAAGSLPRLWSPMSPRVIECVTLFQMLLPDVMQGDFAALKLPFLAVATDFYAMEQVLLDRGPLIPALAASAALPNWARPVVHEGRVLIDGGYVNPVPFDVVMGRADITVAVDVTGETHRNNFRRVPSRRAARIGAAQILFQTVTREKLKTAAPHILVRPEVGRFDSLDFFRVRDILEAAQPAKEQLKRELGRQIETSG